jgi:hypothetical protein
MKRLAVLLVAVALLLPAAANAQLVMQMSNGWSFSFAGNVNAFWVFTKRNNQPTGAADTNAANSNVRTGLLPAFATFEAKGKEAGMNLGVHFGFAPQINTGSAHDHFGADAAGAQIDMRQVYLTVGGDWGQILAGRELGLFSRQNILNDMTLFGVGAIGIGNSQARGTTLGRIGYGYIYPNFVAQLTYSSKGGQPSQFSIGLFEPNTVGAVYGVTKIPRVEAEFTYNQKSGRNVYRFWAGGLWQSTSNASSGGNTISSVGGTAGIRGEFSDLSVVASGYIGKGLGTVLLFSGTAGGPIAANGTDLRTSDGGYVQVGYTANKKTTIAGSWGFSRLKNNQTGDGNTAVRTQWTSVTAGIYHQWTKSLKLVFEGTREQAGVGGNSPAQVDLSGGFMLFF